MSAAPTYAEWNARFLRLTAANATEQDWITARLIDEWGCTLGWGNKRHEATMLMVAHKFVLENDTAAGEGKTVKSKKTDVLSVTFGDVSGEQSYWKQTIYGQQVLALARRSSGRLPRVNRRRRC